jgi:hypothetical protein
MISALTNPKILKETRPLLMPWLCAIFAGGLVAVKPLVGDGLGGLLVGLVVYGFLGGLALVASLSFGQEFHNQTMSLLLSQPQPRSEVWRQKTAIVAGLVLLAVVIEGMWLTGVASWYPEDASFNSFQHTFTGQQLLLGAVFLLATVCSCGYWTIVTQSTIGGLVFTVAIELLTAVAIGLGVARAFHQEEPFSNSDSFGILVIAGVIYSGFFLWFSRRAFLLLELKAPRSKISEGARYRWRGAVAARLGLICAPRQKTLNLVRKEIRLLKPAFQLAGAFVLSWLIVVLVQSSYQAVRINYLFDVITCLYAPVTALLGGCLTLGEEKALGIAEAQLILPIGRAYQWMIKLVTCLIAVSFLCLALPKFLFWVTSSFLDLHQSGFIEPQDSGFLGLACVCGFGFALAFWAIPHVKSTVQAALVTLIAALVLPSCAALGTWYGQTAGGILSWVLVAVMCRFQLSPEQLERWRIVTGQNVGFGVAVAVWVILLYQGLKQFRYPSHSRRRFALHAGIIAGLILAASFFVSDYNHVLYRPGGPEPVRELREAINGIVSAGAPDTRQKTGLISPEDLAGKVSPQTRTWLERATIRYSLSSSIPGSTAYQANVEFPNGSQFRFNGGFSRDRFGHEIQAW